MPRIAKEEFAGMNSETKHIHIEEQQCLQHAFFGGGREKVADMPTIFQRKPAKRKQSTKNIVR